MTSLRGLLELDDQLVVTNGTDGRWTPRVCLRCQDRPRDAGQSFCRICRDKDHSVRAQERVSVGVVSGNTDSFLFRMIEPSLESVPTSPRTPADTITAKPVETTARPKWTFRDSVTFALGSILLFLAKPLLVLLIIAGIVGGLLGLGWVAKNFFEYFEGSDSQSDEIEVTCLDWKGDGKLVCFDPETREEVPSWAVY